MNPISIPPLIIAGISLYVGISYLGVYSTLREHRYYLTFGISAVLVCVYSLVSAGLYSADGLTGGMVWQRLRMVTIIFLGIALFWFMIDMVRYPGRKLPVALSAVMAAGGLLMLVERWELSLRPDIPAVKSFVLPWVGNVTYYEAGRGVLGNVLSVMAVVLFAFIIQISVQAYRKGNKSGARPFFIAVGIMFFGLSNDIAVHSELYRGPYLLEYFFLGLLFVMTVPLVRIFTGAAETRAALEKSEEFFRGFFDLGLIGMAVTSREKNWIEVNRRFASMLGYTQEELKMIPWSRITHPDELESDLEVYDSIIRGEIARYDSDKRFVRKDGSTVLTHVWLRGFRGSGGVVEYVMMHILDVTDEKRAREETETFRELLNTIMKSSPIPIYAKDRDGRFLFVNPAYTRIFGLAPEQLIAKTGEECWPEGDAALYREKDLELLRTDDIQSFEHRVRTSSGKHIDMVFTRACFHDVNGGIAGIVGTIADVTDIKRIQEALRENERALSDIIQGFPTAAFVINTNHKVIHWNRALELLSGIPAGDIIGTGAHWKAFYSHERPCMADLIVDDNAAAVATWYAGKVSDPGKPDGALEAVDFFPDLGDTGKWLRFSATAIRNHEGKLSGAIETLEDITARVIAERELSRSERRFSDLVRNLPVGVFRTTYEHPGRFLMINDAIVRLYGYDSIEDFMSINVADVYYYADERREFTKKIVSRGMAVNEHIRFRKKDGSQLWGSITVQAVRNEKGEILYFDGVVEDITELVQAQDNIRESEEKYRTLIQNIGDAVFSTNRDGVLDFISPSIETIIGIKVENVVGRHFSVFTHPDDSEKVRTSFVKPGNGTHSSIEYRLTKGDGGYRWVSSSSIMLYKDGRFAGIMGVINDIHPRKEAEERLRESEERLSLALRGADLGTWDWDTVTGKVIFNERYASALGYRLDELAPDLSTWEKLLHPDDVAQVLRILIDHMEGRIPFYEAEYRLRCKDGGWKWILDRGMVTNRDAGGRPLRAAGIHQDIEEKKRILEELRISKETYQLLVDNAKDVIFIIQDGIIKYSNPRIFDILGYTKEEICGKSFLPFIHPDDHTLIIDLYRKNLSGETFPGLYDFRVLVPGAEIRWVSINGARITWENRDAMLYFLRDITERKKIEEEIRHLRNLFKNVIDSMPSVIISVDTEGTVTEWNRGAEIKTGISHDNARGRLFAELIPRFAGELERVRTAIHMKRVQMIPKKPFSADGETRFEDITVYPLIADGVEGAVIRIDDVTERVRIEEMMVQSEKMLSVGGLAAGMAHEINNPLAGIMQNASVVLRRMTEDLPPNIRAAEDSGTSMETIRSFMKKRDIIRMLNSIQESGMRAAQIVQDMLTFSRKSDSSVSSHDLSELMESTVKLASKDYDLKKKYDFRNIEIVREYDPSTPKVPCESGKIQQVFLNILKNGAEAMKEDIGENMKPRFILRIRPDDSMVRVEIEDNGPGMTEEIRKRVFEPFYTTKGVGIGTGLGLSVSYFIITESHQGALSVESEPGRGARFIILLPVKRR